MFFFIVLAPELSCRVLHTIFSHLRAHAFARSVTVSRSSAVQASSSRRQERRWAPAVAIHRLGVVEIAPSPHHCFRTAHPCAAQSVKLSPAEPVLSRSSRQRLGHIQSNFDGVPHVCQAHSRSVHVAGPARFQYLQFYYHLHTTRRHQIEGPTAFSVSSEIPWQSGVNGIVKVPKRSCRSGIRTQYHPPVQRSTHSATAGGGLTGEVNVNRCSNVRINDCRVLLCCVAHI